MLLIPRFAYVPQEKNNSHCLSSVINIFLLTPLPPILDEQLHSRPHIPTLYQKGKEFFSQPNLRLANKYLQIPLPPRVCHFPLKLRRDLLRLNIEGTSIKFQPHRKRKSFPLLFIEQWGIYFFSKSWIKKIRGGRRRYWTNNIWNAFVNKGFEEIFIFSEFRMS